MTNFIERVRQALSEDLNRHNEGDLTEWGPENPGPSLSNLGKKEGFDLIGWGMKLDDERVAQAMIPTPLGTIVIDLETEPFFETPHRSVSIDSETDRTIAESDAEYALELVWPEEAASLMDVLRRIGMEIIPTIKDYGRNGDLSYSRNTMRSV